MNTLWLGLRSTLYLAVMIITVAPFSFGMILWSWVPQPRRFWLATGWPRFAIWAGRVICGIRTEVIGWENLPDGPAILLPKHQSAWETLWIIANTPRPLTYVYKRELHMLPFFGWGIATLGMINIDRNRGADAFEQVVTQGTDQLRRGNWIAMFPEGTRTPPGSTRRFKTGGARLAVRTGAMAVPIALNSGELWPRHAFLKHPGTITVSIGPPIDPAGRTAEEVAQAVEGWIETEMRRIAPHRYSAPWRGTTD
jgi:1-acyl-sn-glycerol-3-phosphate acyltransferase